MREMNQHLIAGLVTCGVVYDFEAVQIDEQYGKLALLTLGRFQIRFQTVNKEGAIGNAGQFLTLARVIQPLVRDASGPALRMLTEALGCTSYLMIADANDGLVAVVSEPNRSDMHVALRVGTRTPLEGSAGGRAILAARTAAGRALDPVWVMASLEGGTHGMAVPITGVPGLEASVGIISAREIPEAEYGPRLARSAAEITRMLK